MTIQKVEDLSQKEKYNDLMSAIKEDEQKKEEQNRVDATLEQIKEALTLLQKLLEADQGGKGKQYNDTERA